mmetsp:Transcript_6634/g.16436  ORF Transcript_6634/g.16436 Transcript_6634/m.16436 type:complete len:299 (-) Transcript_6634:257-1153(-)
MQEELLSEIEVAAAVERPQPVFLNESGGVVHSLEAQTTHGFHTLQRLCAPRQGLDLGRSRIPRLVLGDGSLRRLRYLPPFKAAEDTLDARGGAVLRLARLDDGSSCLRNTLGLPHANSSLQNEGGILGLFFVDRNESRRLHLASRLLYSDGGLFSLLRLLPDHHPVDVALERDGSFVLPDAVPHEEPTNPLLDDDAVLRQGPALHVKGPPASLNHRSGHSLQLRAVFVLLLVPPPSPPSALNPLGGGLAQQLHVRRPHIRVPSLLRQRVRRRCGGSLPCCFTLFPCRSRWTWAAAPRL